MDIANQRPKTPAAAYPKRPITENPKKAGPWLTWAIRDEAIIKEVLLRNIYEGEVPSNNLLEDHISLSATKENMVPLTILSLVYPEASIEKLRIMLKNEPIVRKLVIKEMVNLK